MNINITLTITASEALLNALSGLVKPAAKSAAVKMNGTPIQKEPKAVKEPVTVQEETSEAVTVSDEPVSFEQVRAMVHAKNQAGKKDQIKAVLSDFGVSRVTELQQEQYSDFHAKIAAL